MHACVIILSVPLPASDTLTQFVFHARWLPGPAFLMPSTPLLLTRLAFEALSLIMVDYQTSEGGARIEGREKGEVANYSQFSLKHTVTPVRKDIENGFHSRVGGSENMPNSHPAPIGSRGK